MMAVRKKKSLHRVDVRFDVILHTIKKLELMNYKFDIIVNLDVTVPFLRMKDVKGAVELLNRKKCDAVFAVYKQHLNPYYNIVEKNSNGFLKIVKASRIATEV